jgi:hypothetical protein
MKSGLLLVLALSLLVGCTHTSGGVAPSNVPIEPGKYRVLKTDAHGSDCLVALLGFIPVSGGNETRRAVSSALKDAPGADALVNITADSYRQFWILFSKSCTEIHATAVALE